jgi:hypothetical protein
MSFGGKASFESLASGRTDEPVAEIVPNTQPAHPQKLQWFGINYLSRLPGSNPSLSSIRDVLRRFIAPTRAALRGASMSR